MSVWDGVGTTVPFFYYKELLTAYSSNTKALSASQWRSCCDLLLQLLIHRCLYIYIPGVFFLNLVFEIYFQRTKREKMAPPSELQGQEHSLIDSYIFVETVVH